MFSFKTYLDDLNNQVNTFDLNKDLIETIIDPCIKYSKRLKNRDLFFIETNFSNIQGPGIIVKNILEPTEVKREGENVFIPIDLFQCTQIVNNEEIKTLKTLEESIIMFESNNYFILNLSRLFSFMNKSKLNKIKSINEVKTYSDLIYFLTVFKDYYNYRRGK
jgi:hypothetical protein